MRLIDKLLVLDWTCWDWPLSLSLSEGSYIYSHLLNLKCRTVRTKDLQIFKRAQAHWKPAPPPPTPVFSFSDKILLCSPD